MSLNEITIEVTQQCPNRCIYCSSLSDIGKTECLDYATIIRVVDDAVALGAKTVSLSGGEPFLREDIVEIVEYIQYKDLKARLYSSGIYNDGGGYTSIPAKLLEAVKDKIDALIFNYEAVDAELYATIMGTEATNLALLDETIHRVIALGISVEAHLVPMHCNFRQIPDVLSKLYSMGVKNVSLLRLVPQGRVMENKELVLLSSEEQEELKQILAKCQEMYEGKIRLGLPFTATRATCGTGTVKLTVRYDGYIFPCEAFKEGMMSFRGHKPLNVRECRLSEIYEFSEYLNAIRCSLSRYNGGNVYEPCFGQFCRTQ